MQGADDARGSGRGEMAGLQMDTAAFPPALDTDDRVGPVGSGEGL
jgi:hypothetical protein